MRINRIRNLQELSVKSSVNIIHTVTQLFMKRWFVWHKISVTDTYSWMVTVTLGLLTEIQRQLCVILKQKCHGYLWNYFVILIKIRSISLITMMDQKESLLFSQPVFLIYLSMDHQGLP